MAVGKRNSSRSFRSWWATVPAVVVPWALLLALGSSPRRCQAAGPEVLVGKTVEITSSHRYCWYPTIHRFPTWEIMVAVRMSPDEGDPEGDFSAYSISKDAGTTWSRRYTMGSGANMDAAWSPEPEADGKIWHLYGYTEPYPPGQSQDFHLTLTKWSGGGMEFQQWRNVPLHFMEPILMIPNETYDRHVSDGDWPEHPELAAWGTIVHGLNGDLLAVVECKTVARSKYFRDVLIASHDEGKTWAQRSVVAAVEAEDNPWPWMGQEGPNESALVRLADDRLLTVFRTGNGNIGETWSSDDGKTWTPPIAAPFKGVAPRVRRLSNGMLALITGRPDPVELILSVDGNGKEWTSPITIAENHPQQQAGGSTHYTDFIEVEPGKLLVVYDNVPYGWFEIPFADRKSKNVVYGTFVEVHKN
jgi:hypothetical protein